MAKVKKTANKRSSAIKASSGKGWKKKFNLQSRKVQFFVVIAIVALLGGGWFTYKSFAASKPVKSWLWNANQLYPLVQPGCSATKVNDTAKGSNSAILVKPCPKGVKETQISKNPELRENIDYSLYEACVFARGTGQITVVNSERKWKTHTLNASKYVNYCTPYISTVYGGSGPQTKVIVGRNSTAYISALSLHRYINKTPGPTSR